MLEVQSLTKYYGKSMAIEDISFSVGRGEIVGLLGHNGSGKSTTMGIMTGCLAASSGQVLIDGADIATDPEQAKGKLGYLPEIPPVYPDMTVEEQLTFASRLRAIPAADCPDAVDDACRKLNITGVRHRLIENLSKGYRQRVGFAQAILGNPPLIILDEPTVGMDPGQIIELRNVISELGKERTIILSSHILSEITAICSRIIILSNGHLVADDTPERLLHAGDSASRIYLCTSALPKILLPRLAHECGLWNVESCGSVLEGRWDYILSPDDESLFYQKLPLLIQEAGASIYVLKPLEQGLEQVFLQLTQDRRHKEASHESNLS